MSAPGPPLRAVRQRVILHSLIRSQIAFVVKKIPPPANLLRLNNQPAIFGRKDTQFVVVDHNPTHKMGDCDPLPACVSPTSTHKMQAPPSGRGATTLGKNSTQIKKQQTNGYSEVANFNLLQSITRPDQISASTFGRRWVLSYCWRSRLSLPHSAFLLPPCRTRPGPPYW